MKQNLPQVINSSEFPKLPPYGANWQPLYFSPVPGSDETFTVAFIAKGVDGKVAHRTILDNHNLRCLFRGAASKVEDMIKLCVKDAVDALAFQLTLDEWQPPISTFHIGSMRKALADDMDGVLRQALHLGTSLGSAMLAEAEEEAQATEQRNSMWVSRIRKTVRSNNKEIAKLFDREIVLPNGKIKEKVGFLTANYAANFSVLQPSVRSFNQGIRTAQGKLWQLSLLKEATMIDSPSAVELIIGYPNPHESLLTSGEVERIKDGIDELKTEAAGHDIGIFDSSDPTPVAMRLLRLASGI